jgi:hypothetical protein
LISGLTEGSNANLAQTLLHPRLQVFAAQTFLLVPGRVVIAS